MYTVSLLPHTGQWEWWNYYHIHHHQNVVIRESLSWNCCGDTLHNRSVAGQNIELNRFGDHWSSDLQKNIFSSGWNDVSEGALHRMQTDCLISSEVAMGQLHSSHCDGKREAAQLWMLSVAGECWLYLPVSYYVSLARQVDCVDTRSVCLVEVNTVQIDGVQLYFHFQGYFCVNFHSFWCNFRSSVFFLQVIFFLCLS